MRESDLVARRVVLWTLAAVGVCVVFGYLGIGFRHEDLVPLFSGKLAFLGLVVVAGSVQFGAWRRSTGPDRREFADVLRYHRIALGNLVFAALALLVSCGLDALGLLVTVDVAGWRHVAAALLAVTAAPFGESLVRSLAAAGLELDAARREFIAGLRRARLDDRAPTR